MIALHDFRSKFRDDPVLRPVADDLIERLFLRICSPDKLADILAHAPSEHASLFAAFRARMDEVANKVKSLVEKHGVRVANVLDTVWEYRDDEYEDGLRRWIAMQERPRQRRELLDQIMACADLIGWKVDIGE